MSHYIEKVTVSLENLISELARNPSLFLKNPDTDFSRNRKINFKTCVGITMNSGGCTLNKELLDFFDFDVNAPTVSAYTQQRAKILPEQIYIKMLSLLFISYGDIAGQSLFLTVLRISTHFGFQEKAVFINF